MNNTRQVTFDRHLLATSTHKQWLWGVQLLLVLFTVLWQQAAFAEARLMVSPTRIVFAGMSRSAEVTLINPGTSAGTFRISFVRKQMTEEGAYVDVSENESGLFADPYIRFSPRQVTLAPGQSQTVRLMLRKPADLQEGEYRSHMLFQSIPDASTTDIAQEVQESREGVTVRLIPIVGITIPVIVRQGKLSASTALSQLTYHAKTESAPPSLSLTIERSGNESVYGDLIAKYRPKSDGQEYVVGLAKGVAVFTPNALRKFTLALQPPEGVAFRGGELEVDYKEPEQDGGRLLSSATIAITK